MNAVYPTKLRSPYLVAINVTRRCNLSCAYCYLDATQRWQPQSDELGQRDPAPVFAELGLHAPGTIVVLTGGEPLLHGEIEPMVEAGVEADLRVVLGTNGVLLFGSAHQAVQGARSGGSGDQRRISRGPAGSSARAAAGPTKRSSGSRAFPSSCGRWCATASSATRGRGAAAK